MRSWHVKGECGSSPHLKQNVESQSPQTTFPEAERCGLPTATRLHPFPGHHRECSFLYLLLCYFLIAPNLWACIGQAYSAFS
mmetsp:Transcript_26780/g.38810  ORF Transcript_26780/g.38810 Transcript_26780/m.38810 type:complete len:82 (-) Transcript_26780:703-948(-)